MIAILTFWATVNNRDIATLEIFVTFINAKIEMPDDCKLPRVTRFPRLTYVHALHFIKIPLHLSEIRRSIIREKVIFALRFLTCKRGSNAICNRRRSTIYNLVHAFNGTTIINQYRLIQ
ncbi:hypothetical protein D3C81_1966220 [compost metagenome]